MVVVGVMLVMLEIVSSIDLRGQAQLSLAWIAIPSWALHQQPLWGSPVLCNSERLEEWQ